jgi:putative SOS response-associated peptidase YedK
VPVLGGGRIAGMCGRYTLRTKLNLLLDQFAAELAGEIDYRPRYNIAPTQSVLAVRQPEQGAKRELVELRWGLIPVWAKDTKIAYSTINARGDTVAEKPAFRSAFKKRRCLILADGYYEWLREGKAKQPVESCTIITTDANKLASKVHDRMPVILHPDDYDLWLDSANDDRAKLEKLINPFPVKPMSVRPVSTFVNNVKNQGVQCIAAPE